jgi:hypothetical protein
MGIAKFSQLTLCEPSFRLADGIYQNSKDSTAAIKPILAILWHFDGIGQVI